MRPLIVRTVLATTDLEDSSVTALRVAHELGAAAGAPLHVLHVPEQPGAAGGAARDPAVVGRIRDLLRQAKANIEEVRLHIIPGTPADTIRSFSEQIGANVIVLGAHRGRASVTSASRLGNTALAVVTQSSVPCLVVSDKTLPLPLGKILVPVDGSDTARGALMVGLSWGSALRARTSVSGEETATSLTGLYVDAPSGQAAPAWDARALEREIESVRQRAGGWAGVKMMSAVISSDDPARAIIDYENEHRFDLVVLGTQGQGGSGAGKLGSVSSAVSQSLEAPVLLVSPSVWKAHAESL